MGGIILIICLVWLYVRYATPEIKEEMFKVLKDIVNTLNDATSSDSKTKRYSDINSYYSKQTLQPTKQKKTTELNNYSKPKEYHIVPSVNITPASTDLKDDIKQDWLALQLNEERKLAKRMRLMFDTDLAQEHSKQCDAEGIDDGLV